MGFYRILHGAELLHCEKDVALLKKKEEKKSACCSERSGFLKHILKRHLFMQIEEDKLEHYTMAVLSTLVRKVLVKFYSSTALLHTGYYCYKVRTPETPSMDVVMKDYWYPSHPLSSS